MVDDADRAPPPLAVVIVVTPTAAARVFAIGELCEAILLRADPADIVRCRSVNRKLLETVTHAKSVRQKVFLEPDYTRGERSVNPLAPTFFLQQPQLYRPNTVGARINLLDLWTRSAAAATRPLWHKMLVSQPPATSCVIPVGEHITVYHQRRYPDGMTFGDLERAVIAAFEIRKGRNSHPDRLKALSENNSVLIYWPSNPTR